MGAGIVQDNALAGRSVCADNGSARQPAFRSPGPIGDNIRYEREGATQQNDGVAEQD
jgi:hypothetical protein